MRSANLKPLWAHGANRMALGPRAFPPIHPNNICIWQSNTNGDMQSKMWLVRKTDATTLRPYPGTHHLLGPLLCWLPSQEISLPTMPPFPALSSGIPPPPERLSAFYCWCCLPHERTTAPWQLSYRMWRGRARRPLEAVSSQQPTTFYQPCPLQKVGSGSQGRPHRVINTTSNWIL